MSSKEYFAAYREAHRAELLEYGRAYRAVPENKAKALAAAKEYRDRPDNKAKRKVAGAAYRKRPDVQARQKAHWKEYSSRPGMKGRAIAYCARPDVKLRSRANKYGITAADVQRMHEAQNGRCGLCDSEISLDQGRNTPIDHDHNSGSVRGLLCARCNLHLGVLENNTPEWLARAKAWIENGGPS